MAQLIFLNELSHPRADSHPSEGQRLVCQLADVLVSVRKALPNSALISSEPLAALPIGKDYPLSRCLNEAGIVRERVRVLLGLGGRAPFKWAQELFGDPDPGATTCVCFGKPAEGAGLAMLFGGLSVSFCIEPWVTPSIELQVHQLTEDDGETMWTEEIPHASDLSHVDRNRVWLNELRRRDVANPVDLCERFSELFPYVELGQGARGDLLALQGPAFIQVTKYLAELDNAVERWQPGTTPTPQYPPHTTDEHKNRKLLCNFPDANGTIRCCSWHGRYTPGAGRIHFRLETSPKRAILGYVGKKL